MQKRISETTALLSISACLLAAALSIVALDRSQGNGDNREAARSFQRSVRGLGIGSALRPDWGYSTYDPRIDAGDETMTWPVPGGYSYSPEQGMMGDAGMGGASQERGGS